MKLAGLIRLGRDAELRYTTGGDPVVDIAAAWNFGRRVDGKRPTQWAKLALWGERGEKLAEHLKKGRQYFVVCDDVNVETYDKRDGGQGFNLVARVESIEFCDHRDEGGERQERQAPAPAPRAAAPRQAPAPKPSSSFDDMDDDIPF